jgi:glutamine synthetase
MLNTAVAESLKQFADELEKADSFETALHDLIKRTITKHKRIIFNGNGYDDKWLEEAKKRGLLNLKTTPDALPQFVADKNVRLFTEHKVYTEKEMHSRLEILLDNYCKLIHIEGRTLVDIAKKDVLPAISAYSQTLANTILSKKSVSNALDCSYETETLTQISNLCAVAYSGVKDLEAALDKFTKNKDVKKLSVFCKDKILVKMQEIREAIDALEMIVDAEYWPMPTYGDLLFNV